MKKLQWSAPFLLVTALIFALDGGGWLILLWTAALLHECGHLLMLRLLGGRADCVCFRLSGMEIRYSARRLSYWQDVLLALAGPVVNLLCALLCGLLSRRFPSPHLYLFTGVHLLLAAFNLLPALPLDGGRILQALLCSRFPERGQQMTEAVSELVGILLAGAGVILLMEKQNYTLLIASAVILAGLFQKKALHISKKKLQ